MALFRVEHTRNYTVMSNHHLRDKTLSLKAKGLLSLMLSLPEDWDYTLSGLARISAEGKDAIRSAVAELEKAGYVQRSRRRDKQGHVLGMEYVIREQPFFSAQPALDKPASEKPALDKPTQLKKEKNKRPDPQSTDFIPSPSAPSRPGARKEKKRRNPVSEREFSGYRDLIRENVGYDAFIAERPWDASRLDEMVELMAEAVCSRRDTLRVAGSALPQAVEKFPLIVPFDMLYS